jgi:hypothetical protein
VTVFGFPPSWARLASPNAGTRATRAIDLGDVAVSTVVLVVAGATGVQVLWVPDLTWGGWTAWLAAFLWGFATDQFSHAGVKALRK